MGWVPQGGRDGGQAGGPIHQPLGQAFWGKPTSRKALQRWDGTTGAVPPSCTGDGSLAPGARGMAELRGATLPAPTGARWPSPLPWGPAWHGAVSCTAEGAVSWCHLCPWEQPSLSPKSHRGRPRCQGRSVPAVEQDIPHGTQDLAPIPSLPGGPPDPQLPLSPTVGQGTPTPPLSIPRSPQHTAPTSSLPGTPSLALAGTRLGGALQHRRGHGGQGQASRTVERWKCHPQPCSISLELPLPSAPVMAMLMDQVRVFVLLLLLLLFFLSSACTQPLPPALREQQSNLWLCRAMHQELAGGQGGGGARPGGRCYPGVSQGTPPCTPQPSSPPRAEPCILCLLCRGQSQRPPKATGLHPC